MLRKVLKHVAGMICRNRTESYYKHFSATSVLSTENYGS